MWFGRARVGGVTNGVGREGIGLCSCEKFFQKPRYVVPIDIKLAYLRSFDSHSW